MDGLELVSFKIISAVGMAKSSFIEAMKVAANGEFGCRKFQESYLPSGRRRVSQGEGEPHQRRYVCA